MPAVQLFGRKWRLSSDFLPLFAGVGLVFHFCWVIFIIVWPYAITKVDKCNNTTAQRHFFATATLFFILYVLSFIQELLITLIGLRGTPLETSKRKVMCPVLYTEILNWILQVIVVSYGTYVVPNYVGVYKQNPCNNTAVVMLKVLVWSAWAMLAFNWGRVLLVYIVFPDFERADSWAKRMRFYFWYSRSKNVMAHLQDHQRRPLRRLAELYSCLLHGADLSPSDVFVSFILCSAAQRKSRQAHVRSAIQLHKQHAAATTHPADTVHSPSEAGAVHSSKLGRSGSSVEQKMYDTLSRVHMPSVVDVQGCNASPEQPYQGSHAAPSQPASQQDTDSHVIDMPVEDHESSSFPLQCSAPVVCCDGPRSGGEVNLQQQTAACEKADMQYLRLMEAGGTDDQTEQKKGGVIGSRQAHHSRQGSSSLNGDDLFNQDCMLTPSSFACECDPETAPDKLADIYTGHKERVGRSEVSEAARFAKYAVAAYGSAGFQSLHQISTAATAYRLLHARGKDKYKANELLASKIQTLQQQLDYEAIIQIAEMDDRDLLYLNFDNQALGDLPYMLALDQPTKSVVVAVRGTMSVADMATDLLADPAPIDDWLPHSMTQAQDSGVQQGPRQAHAGIMDAATATWKDLRAKHILSALLNSPSSEPDDEDNPEHDVGVDAKHSKPEEHDSGPRASVWDRLRRLLPGSATPFSSAKGSASSGLGCSPGPAEGDRQGMQHSDLSSRGMSKNTSGPLHFLYSRGSKLLAALAMLGSTGKQAQAARSSDKAESGPVETQPKDRDSSEGLPSGAADNPGNDAKCGAAQPKQATGCENSNGSEASESVGNSTGSQYAAHIVKQGLNKEGWKLVITGHSLGAGAAALLALKLKDRYPEVKCWAFCPPGGLLTPNLVHAMKPFCTSVVVNKDCVPRMSLRNVNRLMESQLMALACSRLNVTQIFWGSYGKLNRRAFFERNIFRPFHQAPAEAREFVERFQECTVTDEGPGDLLPPGQVMYLRRFKASPYASPTKQLKHRRRAQGHKAVKQHSSSTVRSSLQQARDQEQVKQDEGEEAYRHAGLQKPEASGDEQLSTGCSMLQHMWHRRKRKKALHASLKNPKDLYWDAVWIEPEDIMREGLLVSPRMIADHCTTSVLRALKAVDHRLAQSDDKSGQDRTQGSSHVAPADTMSKDEGASLATQAALGAVFDLV